jgi:DNA-binding MarR family transcriptional regulator
MNHELLRSIYLEIRDTYYLFNKQARNLLAGFDITLAQLQVLKSIQEKERPTMTDLILKIDCAPSSMSATIRRLEGEGLVKTTRGFEDRREVFVELTQKGRELLDPVGPVTEKFLQEKCECFSLSELETLHDLLLRLKENLK